MRTVSPAEMLKRLQTGSGKPGDTPSLDLLARPSERSAADPRHVSMQRTIEWTWRELQAPERELAGAMAVFAGGCTLAMLEHVSGRGARAALLLDQLMAHSLAHARAVDGGGQTVRDDDSQLFQLYEPIREYAFAQFSAEQTAAWRAGQRAWAIAWAHSLPVTPSLAEVRAQVPNIAAALRSAASDDAGHDAVTLLLELGHTLHDVELPQAALLHASAAVDACTQEGLRLQGHSALAPLLLAAGQKDVALRHALAPLDALPVDVLQRCRALYTAARLRWRLDMGRSEHVLPLVEAGQALAEQTGDPYLQAGLLSQRAWITQACDGDPHKGLALQRQALRHWEAFGNRHAVNQGRYNVAVFEFHAGHHQRALEQFDAIAAEAAALEDWRLLSATLDARGNVLSQLRRWPEAASAFRDSLSLAWRTLSIYNLTHNFWNLPRSLAHLRQPEQALSLAAFAARFWVQHGGRLTTADERHLLQIRRLAGKQLPPRDCAHAWARGQLLSLPEAVALALEP
jgi:tetratricopeptide (TPR) repeat protein